MNSNRLWIPLAIGAVVLSLVALVLFFGGQLLFTLAENSRLRDNQPTVVNTTDIKWHGNIYRLSAGSAPSTSYAEGYVSRVVGPTGYVVKAGDVVKAINVVGHTEHKVEDRGTGDGLCLYDITGDLRTCNATYGNTVINDRDGPAFTILHPLWVVVPVSSRTIVVLSK